MVTVVAEIWVSQDAKERINLLMDIVNVQTVQRENVVKIRNINRNGKRLDKHITKRKERPLPDILVYEEGMNAQDIGQFDSPRTS